MSRSSSPTHVSLPSIQEMFPEHLLGLPERPMHYSEQPLRTDSGRLPLRARAPPPQPLHVLQTDLKPSFSPTLTHATSAPPYMKYHDVVSPPGVVPHSPFSASSPHAVALEQRALLREDDRRHVCDICGKAFNRPSSLAIHINIHTGDKPFACPFPGCGRRFNVNSNMRRHLRNHSSPSARSNNPTPYTYPLTTCPRHLTYNTSSSSITSSRSPSSSVSSSPSVLRRAQFTDSEDESDTLPDSGSYWDTESEVEETSSQMTRLRLRSRSSPGVRRSPPAFQGHSSDSISALLRLQRTHSTSCMQSGFVYNRPAALHPSESQRLRN